MKFRVKKELSYWLGLTENIEYYERDNNENNI